MTRSTTDISTPEDRLARRILIGIGVFVVAVAVGTGVGIWWVVTQ